MTTVYIEDSRQGKFVLRVLRAFRSATIVEKKKRTFEEASAECNARPISEFIDEMHRRIDKWKEDDSQS